MTRALLAGLLLLVLTACSDSPAEGPASPPPSPAVSSTATPASTTARPGEVTPASVDVPAIAAQSDLVPVGLRPDRTMEVPPTSQPEQAAWFDRSPVPGEVGPAVIVGHVNGDGRDGIFARLDEVVPGEKVVVTNSDGRRLEFTVTRTTLVPKDRFPADEVYGDTAGAELRLITCGGELDQAARSYRSNVVVYAAAS